MAVFLVGNCPLGSLPVGSNGPDDRSQSQAYLSVPTSVWVSVDKFCKANQAADLLRFNSFSSQQQLVQQQRF